jgi:glycosyltransferase involved in cell wall biosynthesis
MLRVCLDARLADGVSGGIQQFVMGLASGLSQLDGDEEFLFLSNPADRRWLEPHLSGRCRPLDTPGGAPTLTAKLMAKGAERLAAWRYGHVFPVRIATSDALIAGKGIDVMHFTIPGAFLTTTPNLYQVYDLQHLHLPQFFSPYARKWRDVSFARYSSQARCVTVMSTWVKDDVVGHMKLAPAKVRVIPWAAVTEAYPVPTPADLAAAKAKLRLPDSFALYPAQTFPHKNHIRLVEAIDVARRRGTSIHLVCAGKQNEHYAEIRREIERRELGDLVTFVGFISPLELQCLYRLARCLVFPSLFEGGGMPVFEAFEAGVPVTCSIVTCLPKQTGDAAVLFEPRDAEAIADGLLRLWNDATLRATLVTRGTERVKRFTWRRTALLCRALYRQVAGRPLSAEDNALLDQAPDT